MSAITSHGTVNHEGVQLTGPLAPGFEQILTPDALGFLEQLTVQFSDRIQSLLERRIVVQEEIRRGFLPDFRSDTELIRRRDWKVGPIPKDLQIRRVEITGPVDRKMMINALNSGADVYMADFEDSHSPAWHGTVQGQLNLRDAVNGSLEFLSPEGKRYRLNEKVATLCVRPRGWHLIEKHVLWKGKPVPAALFDFSLYLYHNASRLLAKGTGPYFYLPKLEDHQEARLWNDVFDMAEKNQGLPHATIKCSVLIENLLAAFQMDEILYELRDHITALNFGRWDYIFSYIKKLGWLPKYILPERSQLVMTRPFLHSCSLLLVETCHKRGAYAIGGMAANVPIRNNPTIQRDAIERVIEDKRREASQGYEGAWVAHPDLVPVVTKVFDEEQQKRDSQEPTKETKTVTGKDLLVVPEGTVSENGFRKNISVSLQYLGSWLNGLGSVAINGLMEDTATVEISRAQLWQWIHHNVRLVDGKIVTTEYFRAILDEELQNIRSELGEQNYRTGKFESAARILDEITTSEGFIGFIPSRAYDLLD